MEHNEIPQEGEQANAKPSEATGDLTMEQLLQQGDLNMDLPKSGDVVTGMIASVNNDEIMVSIGAKSEGIISAREVQQLTPEEREKLKVGEEIQVYVVSADLSRGAMQLSYTRSMEDDDWAQAEELLRSKETYEGEVVGHNKGGLIVRVGRLRGFVPASQISQARRMRYKGDTPEQRWGEMVGEIVLGRVIEVDRERRRLILSERAAAQETREALKDRLLTEINIGETRKGRVTSIADFGAFVNINGADGLVHLSELSWERVDHPNKLLKVGDEVEVKVISIDQERKRIGLSMRQLESDPWDKHVNEYKVGQLVQGTVTRLVKFGAFARLDDYVEGLIHISELSEDRIEHPKEVVKEGDPVTLRIIRIESDKRRIGLSLRKVDSAQFSDQDYEAALAEAGLDPQGAPQPEAPEAEAVEVELEVESAAEVETGSVEAEAQPEIEASAEESGPPAEEAGPAAESKAATEAPAEEAAAEAEAEDAGEEAAAEADEAPPEETVESEEQTSE